MSIWILTSYISPTILSVHSQLLSSVNSKFSYQGKNRSKYQIFICQRKQWFKFIIRKQWFKFIIRPYLSTQAQRYTWFPKQSPWYQVIENSYKSRQLSLPQETCFSTEAHLPNLKFPLDLWHQNEFGGGHGSWFRVPIGPTRKTRHN